MGGNFFISSMIMLFGVVLLGVAVAFIRVYWFGKGLPDEQAAKTPGRKWLDSRKKPPKGSVSGKKRKPRR